MDNIIVAILCGVPSYARIQANIAELAKISVTETVVSHVEYKIEKIFFHVNSL